jgi:hypothetical protein
MNSKKSSIRMKVFLHVSLWILFVALAVFLSSGGFLEAADQAEPPAPKSGSQTSAVLATTDGEFPDIRVEVQDLKRNSGGTVTLKFAVINDSDQKFFLGDKIGGLSYGYNASGIDLIDAAGKKKYLVILDSDKKCLCSIIEGSIEPKSRIKLYAKFPAPPEDVKKITIEIPHFTPMEDVPIS